MIRKVLVLLCTALFVVSISGYAYSYDPSSERDNREEVRGDDKPKEYTYPPYTGVKKRIAVTKFENKVKGTYGNWNLGEGMADMLTTELIKTGRFIVVERQALGEVVSEQELGQTGLVKQGTAAKVGQVLGAQILIRGVVSEFEQNESGGGGGIGFGGFRIGGRSSNAHVGIDVRIIDAETGQVLHSHNAKGKAESSGVSFGVSRGGVDFGADSFKNAPIGQATREAIHSAVKFIMTTMEQMPFRARIMKIEGTKVYINAGANMNIKSGTKFYAYSLGEALQDPETGLNLGAEEKLIGTVEVRNVQDKYSIGFVVSGGGMLKKGDVLKFQ
jgi:curli biogenesis system outer membrane secretion channel CsgG